MEIREKAAKYGMRTLSAAELIAAIVGGKDAARIGENVIEYTGAAPSDIARIIPEELTRIDGIGSTKAFAIAAAVEIATVGTPEGNKIERYFSMIYTLD